jgi:hypothetical protein
MLNNSSTEQSHHKMEHLAGKPQGPSLSFTSGSPLVPFAFVFGFAWIFGCAVVFSFPDTAAVSDVVSLAEEPSSQKLTLCDISVL